MGVVCPILGVFNLTVPVQPTGGVDQPSSLTSTAILYRYNTGLTLWEPESVNRTTQVYIHHVPQDIIVRFFIEYQFADAVERAVAFNTQYSGTSGMYMYKVLPTAKLALVGLLRFPIAI